MDIEQMIELCEKYIPGYTECAHIWAERWENIDWKGLRAGVVHPFFSCTIRQAVGDHRKAVANERGER
jgi:hypothetical protein